MTYIFLCGMGQSALSYNKTLSFLKGKIKVDCPELGEFLSDTCCYDKMYASFCDYCKKFTEPINLVGLSLGAVLALNFAIDYPDKVNRLILIAPQYNMPRFLLKVQNILFKLMPDSSFNETGLKKKDFIALANSMARINFSDSLNKVICPTLILCGERDAVNKKASKKLSYRLKKSEFKVVKKAGHEINVDNPKALADEIMAFMCM